MLARLQKLITLGLLTLAALWAWQAWRAGRPTAALLGALLIVGGYALVLAIEFGLLARANRFDPAPPASATQLLRAWWLEVRSAPAVFCWRQPFRSRRWPDRLSADAAGRGVLFIHGFVCNRGLWNPWLERLTHQGVPFVAVNLEPVFGAIDRYVDVVEAAVARLESATGRAPIVVAHSMGGLALRRWWVEPGNDDRVHHAITIGSPHQGTWLARFGMTPNARQMRRGSRWIRALAEQEPPHRSARFTCFYGHCDNIVFPATAATLPGARNVHLPATPHVHMADHPAPWEELARLRLE